MLNRRTFVRQAGISLGGLASLGVPSLARSAGKSIGEDKDEIEVLKIFENLERDFLKLSPGIKTLYQYDCFNKSMTSLSTQSYGEKFWVMSSPGWTTHEEKVKIGKMFYDKCGVKSVYLNKWYREVNPDIEDILKVVETEFNWHPKIWTKFNLFTFADRHTYFEVKAERVFFNPETIGRMIENLRSRMNGKLNQLYMEQC